MHILSRDSDGKVWGWESIGDIPVDHIRVTGDEVEALIGQGVPTMDELLAQVRHECDRRLAALKSGYPESEVLSWDKQEAEARAGGGPLIEALAAARGIDLHELVSRILAKSEAFAVASGTIIGQRQGIEDAIQAGARTYQWPN